MIDCYVSLPHYWAHIRPIWKALPTSMRGTVWSPHSELGEALPRRWPDPSRPVIVAGAADYQRCPGRPVIYVEHGAGQTYPGDPRTAASPSYSGGDGMDRVLLFVCPSETVAARWVKRYPDARAVAVGCPRLDWLLNGGTVSRGTSDPTVAVTFHWECPAVPETQSALSHYSDRLGDLVSPRWRLLGHSHPRAARHLRSVWSRLGVEYEEDADRVLAQADVVVADNTSLMWEAAALDVPVVVLDAPWYRRDVDHGMRFWEWADVGVRISTPDDLRGAVYEALRDTPARRAMRDAVAQRVYAHRDGRSAERAAAAIAAVLEG